ncbi:MAG: excinuclease ABC subunit UvrA [Sphingobacteriales bacterium]|jgi:excinuclease ABC subunit A|nr:excinuclease ABC subunit UvrA [Sphingobacteriales bacterium]
MEQYINSEPQFLEVEGARVHNLRNVSVQLPRNKMVVITGISGSGKSSLAFDTIYAEGQRRYMESFSAYARQFIGNMERPDVDKISGLSPVIAIEQKTTSKNPRSTVGTVTEISDFLRLLFARAAEPYSYHTGKKMEQYSTQQIIDYLFEHYPDKNIAVLAPVIVARKGHYRELFEQIRRRGYVRVRVDGTIREITPKMQLDRYKVHDIEVVIDRLKVSTDQLSRLIQSIETALAMGKDVVNIYDYDAMKIKPFSKNLICIDTGLSYQTPSPNTFSFNSPYGACPTCDGLGIVNDCDLDKIVPNKKLSLAEGGLAPLGKVRDTFTLRQIEALATTFKFSLDTPIEKLSEKAYQALLFGSGSKKIELKYDYGDGIPTSYNLPFEGLIPSIRRVYNAPKNNEGLRQWAENYMSSKTCPDCEGTRLKIEARHFKLANTNIDQLNQLDLATLKTWLEETLPPHLNERQAAIANEVLKEINARLVFLLNVGLNYLSLNRPSYSLSGGEAQRIRLATQIGSQLTGITYILDEPSIGLHQRDNHRLISSLLQLTNMGNTVLVVEHDKDIMLAADHLIDIGPGAGKLGGQIIGQGSPGEFIRMEDSRTAAYLSGKKRIPLPENRRPVSNETPSLVLNGCTGHNLKNINVSFPLGRFICITGVSGSGKSSLVNETLLPILSKHCYPQSLQKPLAYHSIEGLRLIDKVIEVDQQPIGRTPRSNPATYVEVFTDIRNLFAKLPEAQIRGYGPGRFSFNVKGGRCEVCEGGGMKVIEMNFLPDVYVPCERCLGKRYNRETLEVRYKNKSISDVLDMSVDEAVVFFEPLPKIFRMLKSLQDVGLGYLTLGQQATTLSGGEAQRVKLATELQKRDTGRTVYILDEPTTGLHFDDIKLLLAVLQKLVDKGNTVIVIEHNLDVIKVADWLIDIGPEGGEGGGQVLCTGTPETVAAHPHSHTGRFLVRELV